MKKIRLKTFFYYVFSVFLLLIIIEAVLVANRILSVVHYRKTYTSVSKKYNVWNDMQLSEHNFLINYNNDIVFFQTEQNKFIKKSQLDYINLTNFIDSIIKNSQRLSVDDINSFTEIKEDLQKTEQIFEKLSNNLFLRGSNSTGIIGDCFSFYNLSLTYSNDEKQKKYLNAMYDKFLEYLHQPDYKSYQEFMNIFLQLNSYVSSKIVSTDTSGIDTTTFIQSNNNIPEDFINNVNAFKRSYTKLVDIDKIIFMNPNNNLYLQLNESIKKTDSDWLNLIKNYRDIFYHQMSKNTLLLISSLILILLFVSILIIYFPNNFVKRINDIKNYLKNFKVGKFENIELKKDIFDEFHYAKESFNTFATSLRNASQFAYEMSKSNFDYNFQPLSDNDQLGNALILLRDNLIKSKEEEEKRREEDRIRQWSNEGIAKFSDILRQSTGEISALATKVVKELVSYVDANQGGLFILNDSNKDKPFLELIASYAYNKERKKRKRFLLGEGLVGTCALEKATMYMTDIPEDYISISSGLGNANPRSLIIVPLMFEENVLGVIEMASFEELPKYKIEFVEKVAESIASTISIARINEQTAKLLEISKKEAEQRTLKEEELRQNLEELKATQDRAALHERELKNLINLINKVAFIIELDLDGNISTIPERAIDFFELQQSEIIGRHLSEFDFNNNSELVKPEFWQDLLEGNEKEYILKYEGTNKTNWIKTYIIPSFNISGNIEKFISVLFDITDQIELQEEMSKQTEELKEKEKEITEKVKELEKLKVKADQLLIELQGTLQGIDRTILRAEYLPDGTFIDANEYHQKVLGYRKASMINKSILEFIAPDERDDFMKFWKEVAKGKPATLTVKRENKDTGADIWLINYYNPIIDKNNKVVKILYLALDITEQKETEEKLNRIVERSEKNFSLIFKFLDNSSDSLQILKDGKFINCNENTLKLFEFDNKEEFINTSPADVSPEKQPDGRNSMEKATEMINKAMKDGYTSFDWVHRTKTGKNFNCTVNLALIKRYDGDYIYAMVKPKK